MPNYVSCTRTFYAWNTIPGVRKDERGTAFFGILLQSVHSPCSSDSDLPHNKNMFEGMGLCSVIDRYSISRAAGMLAPDRLWTSLVESRDTDPSADPIDRLPQHDETQKCSL